MKKIYFENMDEDILLKNKLQLDDAVTLGYINYKSKVNKSNEFKISYSEMINDLPLVFNCKTINGNYKKINRVLEKDIIKHILTKTTKRIGNQKGTEVIININRIEMDKLKLNNIIKEV